MVPVFGYVTGFELFSIIYDNTSILFKVLKTTEN